MAHQYLWCFAGLTLLSCACGARKEMIKPGTETKSDTSTTSALPPEVYGRYYTLQDVVRRDNQGLEIPAPTYPQREEDGLDDCEIPVPTYPHDKGYHPRYVMFTPGFSHIDYETPDAEEECVYFPGLPPFQEVYHRGHYQFWIADTTHIHPEDSVITTSLNTWSDLYAFGNWRTTFRLVHADASRLVIRAEHYRLDTLTSYDRPRYADLYYRYIPQDSVHQDYTVRTFPSFEAADAFLIPLDGLSIREIGQRRNAPMVLQPDTIVVGAEGGVFMVETSNIFWHRTCNVSALLAYEGSQHTDTLSWQQLFREKKDWLQCDSPHLIKLSVTITPNEDTRRRQARLTIEGDDLYGKFHSLGRPIPSATLVILQEGTEADK